MKESIGITIDCSSNNSYRLTTYYEKGAQMVSIKQNDNREIILTRTDVYKLRQCLEFINGYHLPIPCDYPQESLLG